MNPRTVLPVLLVVAACGGGPKPSTNPTQVSRVSETATAAEVDSLWNRAVQAVRHGKWGEAQKQLDRVLLEFPPGDPRIAQAH
jgi:hypothetical protein